MCESEMSIRYISSFAVDTLHSMINRSLLEMLCNAFPGKVVCYASTSSMHALTCGLEDKIARSHNIYVPRGSKRIYLLLRYLYSAFQNVRILLSSKHDDILFFNFNNVFSLKAIDTINRRFKRRIVVCCHGELEYLVNSEKHSRAYKRLMIRLTNSYFGKPDREPAPGLSFIVLGDVLLQNLRPLISPRLFDRFSSIDHPLISNQADSAENTEENGGILKIGTVGIMNEYKGSDNLLLLAKRLKGCTDISLRIVGHIQCDPEPFQKAGISIPSNPKEPLPENEFRHNVSELDYILLLYPTDTYRLIASGAILDCIRFRKPVIALRTDYFEYLFDKFGSFGILVNDIDEMAKEIERIGKTPLPQYDFDKIASALSPKRLTPQLAKIISRPLEKT